MSVVFEALENKKLHPHPPSKLIEIKIKRHVLTNRDTERICEKCGRQVFLVLYKGVFVSAKLGPHRQALRYCADCIKFGKVRNLNESHLELFLRKAPTGTAYKRTIP